VAVADAYHAMVHDRPYSSALTHEEALEELQRHAGTQFDPEVVEVFSTVYAEAVPPDGLEEVYRLHERARDGLPHLDVHAHPHRHVHDEPEIVGLAGPQAEAAPRARRRAARVREASG
jgi:hypothetical protein